MNAENPVQIDLFGVSATRTKDTRLAEHIGGSRTRTFSNDQRIVALGPSVLAGLLLVDNLNVERGLGL
jgi:hypothetical protein